jgi:outer membrane protein TolC
MGTGWKAEVGFALPIFSERKQAQVVVQRQAEQGAVKATQAGLNLQFEQSLAERLSAWSLAERQLKLYDEALLPQGELALRSLLGQYEAGKAAFQAVLDSMNTRLKDRQARLETLARIHGFAIAQQRVALGRSLGSATEGPGGGMGGSARPAPARSSAAAAPSATQPQATSTSMPM